MNYQQISFLNLTRSLLIINSIIVQAQNPKLPNIANVKSITNGDIACYVDLVDNQGKKYESVYASFKICSQKKTFLNKKVRVF